MTGFNDAIRLDCITFREYFRCLSCTAVKGSITAIHTSRQDESDVLVRLLLGMATTELGKVHVLGEDVARLSTGDLYELRKKIAVVHPFGGLVSNLNIWENLTLPRLYHSQEAVSAIQMKGQDILNHIGYQGSPLELPGFLTTYRKRLVAIGRGILAGPLLMIYNGVLDGLNEDEKENIVSVALEFHREMPERTSLFLTSGTETLKSIPFDNTIRLKGGIFHG